MAARGLKTKIALNVALLLLLSAVITDILVVIVMQSVMIRNEVTGSRNRIEKAGSLFLADVKNRSGKKKIDQHLPIAAILSPDDFPTLQIADRQMLPLHRQQSDRYPIESLEGQIKTAQSTGQTIIQEHDFEWNLFWWRPQFISLVVPVLIDSQFKGTIAAIIPLSKIYQKISKYHEPVFFYIIINTAILTIVGLYRIFRLYLRPIDRIVFQADEFHEDGDFFFAFRQEDNELNRLSSALNRMLLKISNDKKKLQETIISLERANVDLKNAQKEILRAEKMASVGRLAAGIAHEIGNPIGIVLGYLDMLKQNDLENEDKIDFLKRSEDEIQRINLIIRQLLDLARPKETINRLLSLHSCLQDIVDVMRMQPIMSNIRMVLDLAAGNDSVWGNDEQLRQVFLNILLNAADAIHSSPNRNNGEIIIRTEIETAAAGRKRALIRTQFCDNGMGMDLPQLQNIFDPFFTTKEPGKGTGLGLAVSYMIVDGMQGVISADSRIGQGTTFSIDLPLPSNEHQ